MANRLALIVLCVALSGCATTRTVTVPVPVLPEVPADLLREYPGEIPSATDDGVMCFSEDDTRRLQEVMQWYITRWRGLAGMWAGED